MYTPTPPLRMWTVLLETRSTSPSVTMPMRKGLAIVLAPNSVTPNDGYPGPTQRCDPYRQAARACYLLGRRTMGRCRRERRHCARTDRCDPVVSRIRLREWIARAVAHARCRGASADLGVYRAPVSGHQLSRQDGAGDWQLGWVLELLGGAARRALRSGD